MTIHFFTFGDEGYGTSRQRAFKVVKELNARGIAAVIHWPPVLLMSKTPWPQKGALIIAAIRSLRSIKKSDVVYLQRTIANKYFFAVMVVYLLLFRRKMVFDFDDPVYLHSFFKTKVFTRMADAVITCSHAQAEWAKRYNKNVHIFHISLDFEAYRKFTKDHTTAPTPLTIGWVGTAPEHIHNLSLLAPVLKRLAAQKTAPFRFVLIGALGEKKVYDLFGNIPLLDVELIDALDWSNAESVPREIQKFDIGVIPHQKEGEWNKAKTSFKIIEYMACGVPVVASRFGEMPYMLSDGVNGYLADTEDEWVEKLGRLLADRRLRIRLGAVGQMRAKEMYSFDALLPRLIGLIQALKV